MKITRVIAIAVIAASCALSYVEVQAQALKNAGEPAEFPPSSFTGRQYVDSKGCVFIRAGIDGNVTWVPRVSRSRTVVCGYQPSLPNTRRAEAPAPKVVAAATPAPQPAPRVVRTAPAATVATPRILRAPAPQPVTVPRRTATPVLIAPAPAPKPVVNAQPRRVATQNSGCAGRSAVSMRYMGGGGLAVRCGPQAESHVTYSNNTDAPRRVVPAPVYAQTPSYTAPSYTGHSYQQGHSTYAAAPATSYYGGGQRVAPKHVYEKQVASQSGIYIPEGYKRVWMDDRLNPNRAHQTFAGKSQMDLVWTKTTPRRLVVRNTGQVVTHDYPGLVYPYTSYAQQQRANVPTVSSKGQATGTVTTFSSRSAVSTPAQPARAASHRYVQAGVYTTRTQAQQAAQRVARTGVPTRLGTLRKNGQSYSLVLAGPFASQSQLNAAMSKVRGAGFSNAKLRK